MESSPRHGRPPLTLEQSEALYGHGLDELAALPEVTALAGRRVCIVGCTGLVGTVFAETLIRANRLAPGRTPIEVYGVAPPRDAARRGPRLPFRRGVHH